MLEWLQRHRLPRHADTIARVAGIDAAPSDLQYLTEEDIAEIGSEMTRIEKMRLQAALQALGGTTPLTILLSSFSRTTDLAAASCVAEGSPAAGTE